MKISFITVSWNTREKTCACVASLWKHMPEHEVIVVDNHSADDSVAQLKARFPGLKLIENKDNRGFGTANNQGAAIADGDVFCFINNDAEVLDDGLLKLAMKWMTRPEVGVVGPRVEYENGKMQHTYMRFSTAPEFIMTFGFELFSPWKGPLYYQKRYYKKVFTCPTEVEWVSGCCLMIRRDLFNEIGCWDERYFAYCEDPALCRCAAARGKTVWYDPSVTIIHHHGVAFKQRDWVFKVRNHMKSYCIFLFDDPDCLRARGCKTIIRGCWRLVVGATFFFRRDPRVCEKREILKKLIREVR